MTDQGISAFEVSGKRRRNGSARRGRDGGRHGHEVADGVVRLEDLANLASLTTRGPDTPQVRHPRQVFRFATFPRAPGGAGRRGGS